MSAESRENWVDALRGEGASQEEALADLSDFVRRSLAKGFGRQLSDSDLDDLTQDSLVKILEKLDSFRGDSRFTTWATSIAVNQALSALRKRKVRNLKLEQAREAGEEALVGSESAATSAEELLSQAEGNQRLKAALGAALTELQQKALYAKLGGLPMVSISEQLGRSQGAVYKILHDGRKNLLTYFKEHELNIDDLLGPTGGAS